MGAANTAGGSGVAGVGGCDVVGGVKTGCTGLGSGGVLTGSGGFTGSGGLGGGGGGSAWLMAMTGTTTSTTLCNKPVCNAHSAAT